MKVILEAQHACELEPRGIGMVTITLIDKIISRKKYNYELTFFDYNKERNNRQYIDLYFKKYKIPIHECNSLDYRIASSSDKTFSDNTYNDYTGTSGDLYCFFHPISIPDRLNGKMVVLVYDVIPLLMSGVASDHQLAKFKLAMARIEKIQPHILTISESAKQDILKFVDIDPNKIHVIKLGFQRSLIAKETYERRDYEYILYMGAIEDRKNISRIIDAFEIIASKYKQIRLILAGNLPSKYSNIIERINNSSCKDRIILTGYISEEEKYHLLSNALMLVFPSLYEGFGLPVLEAMSCGCPVITSNVSSLPEVAGDAAILIDPYDMEQLACEMERVITSDTLRDEMRNKGYKQSEKFSWDIAAEQVERVYEIAANE